MIRSIFAVLISKITGIDRVRRIKRALGGIDEDELKSSDIKRINFAKRQLNIISKKLQFRFILIVILLIISIVFVFLYIHKLSTASNNSNKEAKVTSIVKEAKSNQEGLPEEVDIKMSFTGDFILGTDEFFNYSTSFNAYYDNYGAEYFLQNVRDTFQNDDITVINMEGTLTESTTRVDKQFAFKANPSYVSILTSSSIETANVANNHSSDYGEQSFTDTVNVLESNGIKTFGYDEVNVVEVKGVKVGFLGIYELDDHLERVPQLEANIEKLKQENVDIIIAVFHWSNELVTVPDENQVVLGHMAIDLGADLVVGHHAHVLQGIETYKDKKIVYGLGNFCFGGNTHPKEFDTMIFQETFHVSKDKEVTSTTDNIIPCSISSDYSINNYQPTILTGDEAQRVLNLINERSSQIVSYE